MNVATEWIRKFWRAKQIRQRFSTPYYFFVIYSLFIVHIGDDDDDQKRRKEQSKKEHEERTIEYSVVHQMEKPEICMFS